MCSPGRADQIRSANSPDSPLAIITVRPDRISSPTRLVGRSEVPAPEPGRQPLHADQPYLALLDEHKAACVRAGQLAQAGGDPVEHGLQVALGVHVGHHVAELAHHPGALGRVVPGDGVLPGPVAHVHPADHLARAVPQRTGVDTQVQQGAVLAGAAGHERDLAAGPHPLQRRVVLGLEFFGDQRRLLAEHFLRAPPEHALRRRVPQQHRPFGAERHDGVSRALHDSTRRRVDAVLSGYHRFWPAPLHRAITQPSRAVKPGAGPLVPASSERHVTAFASSSAHIRDLNSTVGTPPSDQRRELEAGSQ